MKIFPFKKIAVCHGPTCGPHGGRSIKEALESAYAETGIEITERECCGRCSDHNSVMLDDSLTVSHLSPRTIGEFIEMPEKAMDNAQKEQDALTSRLDELLSSDELL